MDWISYLFLVVPVHTDDKCGLTAYGVDQELPTGEGINSSSIRPFVHTEEKSEQVALNIGCVKQERNWRPEVNPKLLVHKQNIGLEIGEKSDQNWT